VEKGVMASEPWSVASLARPTGRENRNSREKAQKTQKREENSIADKRR